MGVDIHAAVVTIHGVGDEPMPGGDGVTAGDAMGGTSGAPSQPALPARALGGDLVPRSRAWLAMLIFGAAMIAVYYVPTGGEIEQAVIYVGMEAVATLAVFAVCRVNRPMSAWALMGAAMLCLTLADFAWFWLDIVAHAPTSPSVADALYLAEYPFFMAAIILVVRGRPKRFALLDSITITIGTTVIVWELIVAPTLADTTLAPPDLAIAIAYPLADVAILAALTGLALSSGLRSTALRLFALGFLLMFVADLAGMWMSLAGVSLDPTPLDAAWVGSPVLWAAAALHPSARVEQARLSVDWLQERTPRLVVLFGVALVVPGSLALEALAGAPQDLPVALVAWAILLVILALRMEGLFVQVRHSERRLLTVLEGSPAGIGISRGEEILEANEAVRAMFGSADRESFVAVPMSNYVAAPYRADLLGRVRARAAGSPIGASFETVGVRADGSEFPLVVHARQIDLADGPATVGFFADVSEQRAAEEVLRASERRYRELFEANPHVMWVYDLETLRFLAVNDMAVQRYGWSRGEFLSMTIADIRPPEDVPALQANVRNQRAVVQESGPWQHRHRDGSIHHVEITSHALTWDGRPARLVLAIDQTARIRLEEQLRQSQKMEAVGRLAGGVAHDFNNLLTAVAGYAQLLRTEMEPSDERIAEVDEILDASDRAAALTRQLLAFSRRQVLQPQIVNLNDTVRGLHSMLTRLIGEDVELRTHLAPALGRVRADPGQLTQVIMNLVVNARDAMPSGGSLTIETANVVLDDSYAQAHPGIRPGPHAMLAVTDSGSGMDRETQGHLFEPFFTTKPVGQGTGLGLATVFGIVQQSEGSIWVYSEPGHGTTFKIYLPQTLEAVAPPVADSGPSVPRDGRETILVVEDEEPVRRLVTTLLARHGYTVVEAARADAGEALAAGYPNRIDLLITDVVMPGGSGTDLAARVVATRPDTRVLFMSGYSQDAIVHHGVLDDGVAFIEKPFAPDVLLRKVRDAVDAPPAARATGEP